MLCLLYKEAKNLSDATIDSIEHKEMRFAPAARFCVARFCAARRAMSTTIPINNVARVIRMRVAGEEDAMKADKIVKSAAAELQGSKQAGYLKMNRTVCKSEWAYEYEIIFSGLDNFKAYMESDFRAKQVGVCCISFFSLQCDPLTDLVTDDAAPRSG